MFSAIFFSFEKKQNYLNRFPFQIILCPFEILKKTTKNQPIKNQYITIKTFCFLRFFLLNFILKKYQVIFVVLILPQMPLKFNIFCLIFLFFPKTVLGQNTVKETVKAGETVYGISKRYGLSENEFLNLNPELQKTSLKTGQAINVPSKNVLKTPEGNFETYTIQKGDTKYSLSKKTGISIADLEKLNPQISNSIKIGEQIKIPTGMQVKTSKTVANTVSVPAEETKKTQSAGTFKTEKKGQLWTGLSLGTEKTISFIIPFSMNEYDNILKNSETVDERLKRQADFIKGSLLALKTLKNEGIPIKAEFVTIEEFEKQPELRNKINTKSSAIILTSDKTENSNLTSAFNEVNIPVIIAQPYLDYSNAKNVYNALPSFETERKAIFSYLKKQDAQIIVFEEKENLDLKKYCPNAKTLTVSESSTLDNNKLKSLMSINKPNLIILNCLKSSSIIASTTALLKIAKDYTIATVIPDSEKNPDFEKVSPNRFKILKMIYPSSSENQSTSNFSGEYVQKNNETFNYQILKGHDITTDSVLRIFQKESFQETVETIKSSQQNTRFDYQKNASGSFSNNALNIMQFEENGNVKKLK